MARPNSNKLSVVESKEQDDNETTINSLVSLGNSDSASNASFSSFEWKEYLKDKCYLFYCPSMEHVAHGISKASKGSVILGNIDWKCFKDGFPDLKIRQAYNVRWANVAFLADLSDPRNIFEQYAIMCALPRLLAKSVKIFVNYFPTGTMERVQNYGEVATASTLARLLSSIPQCARGPVQICMYDIHTLQNQFYFNDNVLVRLESCIGLIKTELRKIQKCSIAFPDEGAHKRFGRFFKRYPQIICTKIRQDEKRIVVLKQGDVENRNIVIIDDLVQTGGTLAQCALILKEKKCESVSCYCTHSVFPNDSWKRFCKGGKNEGLFHTFYCTDTIPTISDILKGNKPFKVLSTVSVILPVIQDDDQVLQIDQ